MDSATVTHAYAAGRREAIRERFAVGEAEARRRADVRRDRGRPGDVGSSRYWDGYADACRDEADAQ